MNESLFAMEWLTPDYGYAVACSEVLQRTQTPFQLLEILETPRFGRVLRLDGALQCSEHDEHFYHEPLIHLPTLLHPAPRTALIVGGGDGGAAEELLKHPSLERVQLVDIDEAVINASRRWLESVNKGLFDQPVLRFSWRIEDGLKFVRDSTDLYDLVFLDLTDAGGPSLSLYSTAFFQSCARRLNTGGMVALHLASPWAQSEKVRFLLSQLRAAFPHVLPFQASVPISGGPWLMAVCSQDKFRIPSVPVVRQRLDGMTGEPLKVISASNMAGLLALPAYIENF
jgi:spermidine synthase